MKSFSWICPEHLGDVPKIEIHPLVFDPRVDGPCIWEVSRGLYIGFFSDTAGWKQSLTQINQVVAPTIVDDPNRHFFGYPKPAILSPPIPLKIHPNSGFFKISLVIFPDSRHLWPTLDMWHDPFRSFQPRRAVDGCAVDVPTSGDSFREDLGHQRDSKKRHLGYSHLVSHHLGWLLQGGCWSSKVGSTKTRWSWHIGISLHWQLAKLLWSSAKKPIKHLSVSAANRWFEGAFEISSISILVKCED